MTKINGRKTKTKIDRQVFTEELRSILSSSTGSDYAGYIAADNRFLSDVLGNVEETSAWQDEGCYNDDDIRLAIGRILMDRLGVRY